MDFQIFESRFVGDAKREGNSWVFERRIDRTSVTYFLQTNLGVSFPVAYSSINEDSSAFELHEFLLLNEERMQHQTHAVDQSRQAFIP